MFEPFAKLFELLFIWALIVFGAIFLVGIWFILSRMFDKHKEEE